MSYNPVPGYGAGFAPSYGYGYQPFGYPTLNEPQPTPDPANAPQQRATRRGGAMGDAASYIVPLSVAAAALNDPFTGKVAQEIKDRTLYQVKQAPGFLANLSESGKKVSQTIAEKTQQVAPAIVKLGQSPTLSQIAGIGDKTVTLKEIRETGGKAWLGQVKENFSGAFRANEHTQGLSPLKLLGKRENWKQIPTVLGRTAHATFTRPIAESLAGTGNLVNGALTTLALGTMAWDIGSSTVKTNARARSHEDGSWQSRLETFKETTGTFARKTLKHGLTWTAGSLGFVAGKALGATSAALGPAGKIIAIGTGVIGGSFAAGGTQAILNKVLPDPE